MTEPALISPSARAREVVRQALPIIGGMASQNVLNLVDTGMVGRCGEQALAAVGLSSMLNFFFASFITGMSAGVQAMAARRVGEGRDDETAVPLNGGLLLALALAGPMTIGLWFFAPSLMGVAIDDPAVRAEAIPYFQARALAMIALGMNFSFRGYWNAIQRAQLYMGTLVVMHVSNVILNYLLIFGVLGFPELGATGAGVASAISTWIGTGVYIALGLRYARANGFLAGLPHGETVRTMLRLSLPAGVQNLFFAGGMTTFMLMVGELGTRELAVTHVLVQLLLVGILPGLAFGFAGASFVGQALGRGEPEDAARWGWDVVRVASLVVGLATLPAAIAPDAILSVFIEEPEVRALGIFPLRLLAVSMATHTIGSVLMNGLLGAGYNRRVMIVSVVLQWGLFLPAVFVVGPWLGLGLGAVFIAQVAYGQLQSIVYAAIWRSGRWKATKV